MLLVHDLTFILFAALVCSWGWGMRGTTIGGEKGAMLPGALLGMAVALFSRSNVLFECFPLLAGMGAVAMFCGGNMTYGETLSLSMASKPAPNMKKGLCALAVKGGIWFGIFGGMLGMYISVLSGLYYSLTHIIVFALLLPICALAGFFVLNKPFDPKNGKFPKIYFSVSRKETWGGLFGIFFLIAVFALICADTLAFVLALSGFFFGGFGWIIGQLLHIWGRFENRRGKFVCDRLKRKGLVDAWKIMECVFGAIGGGGIALSFCLCRTMLEIRTSAIDSGGIHSILSEKSGSIVGVIFAVLLVLDTALGFIKLPETKRDIDEKLRYRLITPEEHRLALTSLQQPNLRLSRLVRIREISEFALYSTVPMLLMLFGSTVTAALIAFPVVFLVLSQEYSFICFRFFKSIRVWQAVLFMLPTLSAVLFFLGYPPGIHLTLLLYTFVYEVMELIRTVWIFRRTHDPGKGLLYSFGSATTVHAYFLICCTAIMVISAILF